MVLALRQLATGSNFFAYFSVPLILKLPCAYTLFGSIWLIIMRELVFLLTCINYFFSCFVLHEPSSESIGLLHYFVHFTLSQRGSTLFYRVNRIPKWRIGLENGTWAENWILMFRKLENKLKYSLYTAVYMSIQSKNNNIQGKTWELQVEKAEIHNWNKITGPGV